MGEKNPKPKPGTRMHFFNAGRQKFIEQPLLNGDINF